MDDSDGENMGDSDGENIGLSEEINSKDAGNDRKEMEAKILELKKGKRAMKTATTKVQIEENVGEIEKNIEMGNYESKKAMSNELDNFETEINECISKAETVLKGTLLAKESKNVSVEEEPSLSPSQQSTGSNVSGEAENSFNQESFIQDINGQVVCGNESSWPVRTMSGHEQFKKIW
ncbi:Hypothetical predicted protein [Paramuricea clavata]|uniref:Uncharacterized protein n=1 Tax=Paramuricea clavata TaxID=317549 RepID=A0A6S7G8H4_PARCT|nr:Hypothetical predicted protein [Paramuricea clavata]